MRFLVLSDIHYSSPAPLFDIIKGCDGVIFAGDGERALSQIRELNPNVYAVRGNCDAGSSLPDREILSFLGNKILLCHGHKLYAKRSYEFLVCEAKAQNCSAVIFGHTHKPYFAYNEGVCLMNPGSFGEYPKTYGFLDVTKDGIMFSVIDFVSHKIIL